MEVAIIGGGGTIGCSTAYTLAIQRPDLEITLADTQHELAEGHAIDARHGRTLGQLPQFEPDGVAAGVEAAPSVADAVTTADVAVVAASAPRPTGAAQRGGRDRFLEKNAAVADSIADTLADREPFPVVVVTNPVDHITYRLWQETGWDRSYFLGYSLSETARTADKIATLRDVPGSSIYCPTVGEHGENVVPVFSRLTIGDEPVSLTTDERREVRDYIRDIPYDIIELRGQAETSRWVTGQGVARLTRAVVDGGLDGDPISLSVPLSGEYGYTDVCLSVPVRIGRNGVERILEWELNDEERSQLDTAYESVKETL